MNIIIKPPVKDRKPEREKLLESYAFSNNLNKGETTFTPAKIVLDMLELLPSEIWSDPNATFLDPCCKSGRFLDEIYYKLFDGLNNVIPHKQTRRDHILSKQLFGMALTTDLANFSRMHLYGCEDANGGRSYTKSFGDNQQGNIRTYEIQVKQEDGTKVIHTDYKQLVRNGGTSLIDRVKGVFGDMTFDVVIGNPPYNSGMDLDFVNMGFDLCKQYCVMITPAKWQTAADDYRGCASKTIDYAGFRKKLVPHMSKVVFYPSATDVFDIEQRDGITYYVIDKNKKDSECEVVNIFKNNKYMNNRDKRDITHRESLNNIGNEIVEYLKHTDKFKFKFSVEVGSKFQVWTNTQLSGSGGNMYTIKGDTMCICESRIIDAGSGEKSSSTASRCTFSSASRVECESFISWLDTKFTRFFVAINISKLTGILTDDYFRFVPAPPSGKFDHIYTDQELYQAFNLPQKYIDVIEAVIKERK